MDTVNILGVNSSATPLSDAFSIDIISKEFTLSQEFLYVTNVSFSIYSDYIDTFSVLDEKFITTMININIRIDYVSIDNSINYEIIEENKLIDICIGRNRMTKNLPSHVQILDANIAEMDNSIIRLYILYICSLDM